MIVLQDSQSHISIIPLLETEWVFAAGCMVIQVLLNLFAGHGVQNLDGQGYGLCAWDEGDVAVRSDEEFGSGLVGFLGEVVGWVHGAPIISCDKVSWCFSTVAKYCDEGSGVRRGLSEGDVDMPSGGSVISLRSFQWSSII